MFSLLFSFRVVCYGFPEQGQKVTGFRYIDHQQPCDPKQYMHRDISLKLRDYTVPPCKLEYTCAAGYKKLYDEIECLIDGTYDKKAFCVDEVTLTFNSFFLNIT